MKQPDLIPRKVLFGNPTRISPAISPDGRRLAYIAPSDGVLNVWVGTLGGDDFQPVTEDRDRGIRFFAWAHDNRHLLHIQDRGGDEEWHVYATDLAAGGTRDLTPFNGVQARFVAMDRHFPDTLLVAVNRRTAELHDVYRLHLPSGELTLVAENPGYAAWVADRQLQVRAAVQPTPDGGMVTLVRDTQDGDWRTVHAVGLDDALTTNPIGFTSDGASLLMISSRDADTGRLLRLRLDGGAGEVLFEDPQCDVVGVVTDPDTREPELVTVLRERSEVAVLNPAIATDVERVRSLHPGDMALIGRDHANLTWLAAFTADDGPVYYFAYERGTGKGRFLFTHRPELENRTLARMEPFSFTARDGLTIHGYLSFPPGLERRGLPTVLDVHGGPWVREPGVSTRRPNGWPIAATSVSRSTTGARPDMASGSSVRATVNGQRRCTTTSSTRCAGWSTTVTRIPRASQSTEVRTAATPRWWVRPSRPICSAALLTWSARQT